MEAAIFHQSDECKRWTESGQARDCAGGWRAAQRHRETQDTGQGAAFVFSVATAGASFESLGCCPPTRRAAGGTGAGGGQLKQWTVVLPAAAARQGVDSTSSRKCGEAAGANAGAHKRRATLSASAVGGRGRWAAAEPLEPRWRMRSSGCRLLSELC